MTRESEDSRPLARDNAAHVPCGLAHIAMIGRMNAENRKASEVLLRKQENDLRVLGIALTALYEAATCHRKCRGDDHVLEALGARIYNLSCAAYSLISIGFYDEALSLVRSIGEIANLLSLSVNDKPKFLEWLRSTKATRMKEFSPAKIRELLAQSGLVLMDKEWYSDLCEGYTHVTPETKPNNFNEEKRNIVGGVVQDKGVQCAIEQLTSLVSMVALFYCRYFELDDLFDAIVSEAKLEMEAG